MLESQAKLTKIVDFLLVTIFQAWVIFFVTVSMIVILFIAAYQSQTFKALLQIFFFGYQNSNLIKLRKIAKW